MKVWIVNTYAEIAGVYENERLATNAANAWDETHRSRANIMGPFDVQKMDEEPK